MVIVGTVVGAGVFFGGFVVGVAVLTSYSLITSLVICKFAQFANLCSLRFLICHLPRHRDV